ncbi:fibronectin type III domain-containing protein [Acidisphaera sp. S103]|uniref:fibronectin type III domain-containing protein n=1 Tax=Acidisphaera sp. S103 TaxID=1747223 RepID=UPI00131DD7BE|nr:fibronectin type III domain-containing protein [Acidisphaera sp. S103]
MTKPPEEIQVFFAWDKPQPDGCWQSQLVRLVQGPGDITIETAKVYTYAARVPAFGTANPFREGSQHKEIGSPVPMATMFVRGVLTGAPDGDPGFVLVQGVGISSVGIAVVSVFGCALLLFAIPTIYWWWHGRPGWFLLRLITAPDGKASLSQFQITIWTVVIGTGVAYTMVLTGNLIDVPTATLGLLGISGFSLVGAKLKSGDDGSPQRVSAPGAVTNLAVVGAVTTGTVVLTWDAPAGTGQPFSYTVQKRPTAGGPWETVQNNIAAPPYAVINLNPGWAYDFQVFAMNAGGAGPASVPLTAIQTHRDAPVAPGGPAQVTGLQATAQPDGRVELTWTAPAPGPDSYTVQYRPVGTLAWSTYSASASPPTLVTGLRSATNFAFQVFGVTGGVAGTPSTLVAATTFQRAPRWSDLVMNSDYTEVDLARLQMLVFTSIAAVFTGLTLFNTGAIPDIPVGELALVGVSNGVYLASKAVTD